MATRAETTAKQLALGRPLALGTLRGLWTLEDFDRPSPGVRSQLPGAAKARRGRSLPPPEHRNLAREWIAANDREWNETLRLSLETESVDHLPTGPEIMRAALGLSHGSQ